MGQRGGRHRSDTAAGAQQAVSALNERYRVIAAEKQK